MGATASGMLPSEAKTARGLLRGLRLQKCVLASSGAQAFLALGPSEEEQEHALDMLTAEPGVSDCICMGR